jgi:serine/threonine protein kinase
MTHPNIIETHKEGNRLGEEFLVEKKLPVALSDSWEVNGLAEAANLLYDIALALQFLHGRDLVHGDIKPDNLGFGEDRFILLDFGICRKSSQFSPDASATGSLRTRAPELLLDTTPHAFATDIYALGAVIFYFLTGTFPLFERNENVPRSSEEEKRAEKVDELKERASDRYSQLVFERLEESLDHEGMRHLLAGMLALDPHRRPDADQVVSDARSRLVAFIRAAGGDGALSLEERLDQLHSYLPEGELSSNLPRRRLIALQAELDEFEFNELDGDRKQALGELKKRTSEKGSS